MTGEYYLHLYAVEQPDLNWEHPQVRDAVHDIMLFWLNKGCDGFRMDVINFISKNLDFPDAAVKDPDSVWQWGDEHYANGPRLHEYLHGLGEILEKYDAFSVGEMPFVKDTNEVLKAVGFGRKEINMVFSFEHVDIDHGAHDKFAPGSWKLTDLKKIFARHQTFMYEHGGWNALYWENHDQPRSIDRYTGAREEDRVIASKMLATILPLQSGTPFVYQGQELGMRNVPVSWDIEEYKDIDCLNHWKRLIKEKPSDAEAQKIAKQEYQKKSRDNARMPVQWSPGPNAGFTGAGVKPWMSINPDYVKCNAEQELDDPKSTFNYWSAVLTLRKKYLDVFVYGDYFLVDPSSEEVFAYSRQFDDKKALILANWTDKPFAWDHQKHGVNKVQEILLSNYEAVDTAKERFGSNVWSLRPYEAAVLFVE